ncbi:Glycoside hydrolase family 71 protein [Rutstroemia sp. NJR-2017a BVV2]|nr:Glycoside hydrolase family 71 protein [Rutstroemia sp. NJR-2017a BVV2]
MELKFILTLLALTCHAQAKAVFAYFMLLSTKPFTYQYHVGNTPNFTNTDWQTNIALAKSAHIDAFALNMAHGDSINDAQVPLAFAAAEAVKFSLFFSFDYAGNGPWPQANVLSLLNAYISSAAYYNVDKKPFVSTFEGPANAIDWIELKAITNCLFYPDYFSLGAKNALLAGGGAQVDGPFSKSSILRLVLLHTNIHQGWAAWPWGNTDMNTYVDASYSQFLNEVYGGNGSDFSHYMMAISPWFFTNLPGFHKNWLWRGDSLWYDRWAQANYLQPEFINIVTWNDFGESHYIGPLDERQYYAFQIGKAPYNYALDMPHDCWRVLLPYLIDTYKNDVSTITQEILVGWYRPDPVAGSSCATGDTSGNTHSQFQVEFHPGDIVEDNIHYSAPLSGPGATVTATIGGNTVIGGWAKTQFDGIGIYHGNVSMNGHTGAVTITLSRGGAMITGKDISTNCTGGIQNWNTRVGYAYGENITATPTSLSKQVCIAGTGAGNFLDLCQFTCVYGYCPMKLHMRHAQIDQQYRCANCSRTSLQALIIMIKSNYGNCPSATCGTTKEPESTPTISPFIPDACTGGSGSGNLTGLCRFACKYGFYPIIACSCGSKGALGTLPVYTGDDSGVPVAGLPVAVCGDLCKFAYQYGYNSPPIDVCINTTSSSGSHTTASISGTASATKTSSAPSATNTFNIYEWECSGKQQIVKYGAAAASAATDCASQNSFVSNEGGITKGDTFNVCGSTFTVGAVSGSFAVTGGGKSGTCSSVAQSPVDVESCKGTSGDIDTLACKVSVAYKCNLAVC